MSINLDHISFTWQPITPFPKGLETVVCDNSRFITFRIEPGKGTKLAISTDGINWNELPCSGSVTSLCACNGLYAAINDKKCCYSTDLESWKEITDDPVSLKKLIWTGDEYIALCEQDCYDPHSYPHNYKQTVIYSLHSAERVWGKNRLKHVVSGDVFADLVYLNGEFIAVSYRDPDYARYNSSFSPEQVLYKGQTIEALERVETEDIEFSEDSRVWTGLGKLFLWASEDKTYVIDDIWTSWQSIDYRIVDMVEAESFLIGCLSESRQGKSRKELYVSTDGFTWKPINLPDFDFWGNEIKLVYQIGRLIVTDGWHVYIGILNH